MRIDHLHVEGLTSAGVIDIDLSEIPPGIVALVGPNGAGKTTLLEATPAAMYRQLPTRGDLYPFVRDRAEIEVAGEHDGSAWRALVTVDRAKKRQTGALYIDGIEVTDGSGGVTNYDQVVAERFPPLDLFLAAAFAAQDGGGSFASAKQTQRRELLRRALGLARWQSWWRAARDAGAAVDRDVERIHDRTADIDTQRQSLADASARADVERQRLTDARELVELLTAARDAAREHHQQVLEQLRAVEREVSAWRDQHSAAVTELQRCRGERQRIATDLDDARAIAQDLARLQSEQDAYTTSRQQQQVVQQRLDAASAKHSQLDAEVREARQRYIAADTTYADAQRQLEAAEAAAEQLPALREQAERAAAIRGEIQAAQEEIGNLSAGGITPGQRLADAERQVRTVEQTLSELRSRADVARRDAALLGDVPCNGLVVHGRDCGSCPLLKNAREADRLLPRLNEQIEQVEAVLAQQVEKRDILRDAANRASESQSRVSLLSGELLSMQSAELELRQKEQLAAGLDQTHERLASAAADRTEAIDDGKALAEQLKSAAAVLDKVRQAAQVAIGDTDGTKDVSTQLEAAVLAHSQVPLLESQLQLAEAAQGRAQDSVAKLGGLADLPDVGEHQAAEQQALVDLGAAQTSLDQSKSAAATASARLTGAETEANIARDAIERAELLIRRIAPLERRRAGLQVLEQACGPTGVQALEMDAAGPGISDCVNAILEVAYGGRFAVSLVTQAEKAAGGWREVCDVDVVDAVKDWRGPIKAASGGERVVIEAALRLGIAAYLRGQGGDWRTVFLDEADGALDAQVSDRWPQMLRAAATMSGAHHTLIVSHRENVWRQADAVVLLGGDGARVCDPGEV
jgi:exonuclease SbcC